MNIWQWVFEKEQHYWDVDPEFADLIDEFPRWVIDQEEESVRNNLPGALQKCKTYEEPWLEVYFRHWYMQMEIVKNSQALEMEDAIIDLLNFSHKEETKGCPQSVCVVQDFCIFYGLKDGPSYVEERKKIANETLERITPEWACYSCISTEYASALIDAETPDKAVEYLNEQSQKMKAVGNSYGVEYLLLPLARAYNENGQYEKAIKLLASYPSDKGKVFQNRKNIHLALASARTGKAQYAKKILPKLEDVSRSVITYWLDTKIAISQFGDEALSAADLDIFMDIAKDLEESGVYNETSYVYQELYKLYKERGDLAKAQEAIDEMKRLSQYLRHPEQALKEIEDLQGS